MFKRPISICLAGFHVLKTALHANRSKIDMTENDDDHDDADNGMPGLGKLHIVDAKFARQELYLEGKQ